MSAFEQPYERMLRDSFAIAALTGLCAADDNRVCPAGSTQEEIKIWRNKMDEEDANYCWRLADAMLATRSKQTPNL